MDCLGLSVGRTVVDVGAGTGKLTRLLIATGARVVAVEPIAAMRALLPPGVESVEGTAEKLPLAEHSVDAVTIAQALHWFRLDLALRELQRVLRRGGRLAVVWNRRNEEEDPLQAAFGEVLLRHRSHPSLEHRVAPAAALGRSGFFTVLGGDSFPFVHELAPADLVALAASESSIALLGDDERAAALDDFARLAPNAAEPVSLRYVTEVVIAAARA